VSLCGFFVRRFNHGADIYHQPAIQEVSPNRMGERARKVCTTAGEFECVAKDMAILRRIWFSTYLRHILQGHIPNLPNHARH
jgi:hypothetical protein